MNEKILVYGEIQKFQMDILRQLVTFLEKELPQIHTDWWELLVKGNLSYSQRMKLIQYKVKTLKGLDLAGLLLILEKNWNRIDKNKDYPREFFGYIKDMQTMRNRWAHPNTEGFPRDDIFRDLDILQRFAKMIGASDALLQEIQNAKDELFATKVTPLKQEMEISTVQLDTRKFVSSSSVNVSPTIVHDGYSVHPSTELVSIFKERPYQGQQPEKASILILGNDANYSEEISNHTFFKRIIEYHSDGVKFWQSNEDGVHHPFLLSSYPFDKRKGGLFYHRNFARLGLTSGHAEKVSFVELLDVPTIGVSSTNKPAFNRMLKREHLQWLEYTIMTGNEKIVLLNQSFFRILPLIVNNFSCFNVLAKHAKSIPLLQSVRINDSLTVFNSYSFSATQFAPTVNNVRESINPFL